MALDWNGMSISDIGNNNGKKYNELEETTIWHGEDDNLKIANNARKQRKDNYEKPKNNKIETLKSEFALILGGGFSLSHTIVKMNQNYDNYFELSAGIGVDGGFAMTYSKNSVFSGQNLNSIDYKNKDEINNLNVSLLGSVSITDYNMKGHQVTELSSGLASGVRLGVSTQKTILQFRPNDVLSFVKDNVNMVFRRIFYETNYYPYLKR